MTFCAATMCPLFAADGSPWTGEQNAVCPQDQSKCGWYSDVDEDGNKACAGCSSALEQVDDVARERPLLQIGRKRARPEKRQPTTFDCPRAAECQWQAECSPALCPPRYALSLGVDPRACAY